MIDDMEFPARLAHGATGGPQWRIDVVRLVSGHEQRNQRWSRPRRRYTLSIGPRPLDELRALLRFFEERRGALRGFLFTDPADHVTALSGDLPGAADVAIGTGDGTATDFQLLTAAGQAVRRPKPGSVRIAVDGGEIGAAAFSVDAQTGFVTLASPPAQGSAITAGCAFFIPVRFENSELMVTRTAQGTGETGDITLLEILS